MAAVKRIVMTVTLDDDTTGSVILTREPGSATVGTEYEPTIGDTARVVMNALIETGIFRRD
jgi:hypothetical protein